MPVELVDTQTTDGIRLHGALSFIGDQRQDLVICLHGVGSNFYGSSMMNQLAEHLVSADCHVLRVNTRGHDSIYTAQSANGPTRLGAAYEVVDHCRMDVAAWTTWSQSRCYQRVILLGHSLGAIKVLYAQARQPQETVAAVAALSPPRLSASVFRQSSRSSDYLESLFVAQNKIEQGRGEELIEIRFPFPMIISASSFHDKYGPQERYNILGFVDQIRCPALYVYGAQELESGGPAFAGLPQAIQERTAECQSAGCCVETQVVPGADHLYTQAGDELCRVVSNWLRGSAAADASEHPLKARPD